jgi:hypothetical protein
MPFFDNLEDETTDRNARSAAWRRRSLRARGFLLSCAGIHFVKRNTHAELQQVRQGKALLFQGLWSRTRCKTSPFCNEKSTFIGIAKLTPLKLRISSKLLSSAIFFAITRLRSVDPTVYRFRHANSASDTCSSLIATSSSADIWRVRQRRHTAAGRQIRLMSAIF